MQSANRIYDALYRYTRALSVALGFRDPMTRLHSERVFGLAMALGEHCGLAGAELGILKIGASFHDIGKIGIPDRILLKPAPFDGAEWQVMRQHAEIGEQIILSTEIDGAPEAARVIRHHHEYFDGHGYPDGLAGEAIPIASRIVSIVDSYDAMAVTRAYHHAKEHAEVMAILHGEAGTKHDPELLRTFARMIEASPFKHAGV
ncbi:MAG TPA: HD domain-containing phosphohydrolase [Methylococcaceae bacterium]|nr:HD domain-containing phosphohydrolase [Methylococcaceae bacterium]